MICLWTGKLPAGYRDAADEQLLAAFAGGLGLADLAGLFAEMYVRARGDLPDQDREREFADREVKLATTIGGAGVLHGDLTAECAAAVAAVLDALAAPAGKEDDRTKGQRYHDALARSDAFAVILRHDRPADGPGARLAQGRRIWPLGRSLRRGGVGPAQLERGTGQARPTRPATPGQRHGHRRAPGREMAMLLQRVNFDWPTPMPAAKLRTRGHGDRGRVFDSLREPVA